MSRIPFNSVGGFSVGPTGQLIVIDPGANISASGGTFSGNVVIAGNITVKNVVSSFNGSTGAVNYSPVLATSSLTGVASFNTAHFSVATTGHVSLASSYTVTGDTVVAGTNVNISRSGNSVTVNSTQPLATSSVTGVASFGNEFVVSAAGAVSLTGNYVRSFNGSTGTVVYAPPIATSAVTGVASFGNEFIVSAAGAVSLTGNYVRSFNGATGTVVYAPPVATTSVTGVASFNSSFFTVSSGAVSLASGYQVTGDTVAAGTNVNINRSGNTVTVNSTQPLASATITGVASFGNEFIVSAAGAVSLTGNYVRSFNGSTGTVVYAPPLATTSVTGVASFNTNDFTVTTGAVSLSNVARTNAANTFTSAQTFNAGITTQSLFVSQGATFSGNVVVTNFRANTIGGDEGGQVDFGLAATNTTLTGGVSIDVYQNRLRFFESGGTNRGAYIDLSAAAAGVGTNLLSSGSSSPPLATNSVTGVASFGNEFVVSAAGAVSLTGNYVRSFNGATGTVVYAPPLATTAVTGVASFNTNDFTVTTGAVSLSNVARTNAANTFTSAQTFNSGITTQSAFISQGLTVGGRAAFTSGITSANLFVGAGTTLNSSLYVGGNSTLGGTTANIITLPSGQVIKTYFAQGTTTSTYTLFTESQVVYGSADILIQAEKWGDGSASSGFFLGTVGLQNLRISAVTNPNGQTVNHVQYGNVFVGSTAASFDVDTDGALGWRLRVTPNSTYVTTIRAQAILSPNLGGAGA